MNVLKLAQFYATTKHGTQLYGASLPYMVHVLDVVHQSDIWWGTDPLVQGEELRLVINLACMSHDLIEDTGVKQKELAELFGDQVADIVWRVTNEPGANRKIRHALTYPKIRENPLAVYVKLCDRIANVSAGGKLIQMYQKEHEDFKRSLQTAGQFDLMWTHLAELLNVHA